MGHRGRLPWVFCVLAAVCCLLPVPTHAQVPHLIRYQGQVSDSQHVPLEGPYDLTFRLYDAITQGTKIWEETQPNIVLTNGHFTGTFECTSGYYQKGVRYSSKEVRFLRDRSGLLQCVDVLCCQP